MKQTFCLPNTVHNLPLSQSHTHPTPGSSFLGPQTSHKAADADPWALVMPHTARLLCH